VKPISNFSFNGQNIYLKKIFLGFNDRIKVSSLVLNIMVNERNMKLQGLSSFLFLLERILSRLSILVATNFSQSSNQGEIKSFYWELMIFEKSLLS
jgi:hypothetical protein